MGLSNEFNPHSPGRGRGKSKTERGDPHNNGGRKGLGGLQESKGEGGQ